METTTGELITTIVHNEENTKTFEIKREFKGIEGEDIILLQLFPTLGKGDEFTMDSTNRHIINHRQDLNIRSIRFINLFATRCNARMSTRNVSIDEENIKYIESVMKEKNFKKYRFVVAYGCTMNNCTVATKTKFLIFKLFKKYNPEGEMYQISVDGLDSKNANAVHILFLGIRHSNSTWFYEKFTIPELKEKVKEGEEEDAGSNKKGPRLVKK